MAVTDAVEPYEAGDALAAVREIAASAGVPASVAVDRFLAQCELAGDALVHYARIGLVTALNNDAHDARDNRRPSAADWERFIRFQPKGPHGRSWPRVLMLWYVGADGVNKPLAVFTAKDCQHVARVFRQESAGLRRRSDALARVARLMGECGAATVGELPVAERREAVSVLEEVWR